MSGGAPEIERVWRLTGTPAVPSRAEIWRIDQGYLPEHGIHDPEFSEGRLRRVEHPDGRVTLLHTVKRGTGVVRQETERQITPTDFDRLWPLTQGRRVRKVRHRVPEGALTWEVDQFLDWPLWMAEVELPSEHHALAVPVWLQPVLGPEVSTDPRWRNHALALHGPPSR
jgi:CYTH domain-containing protein